MKDQIPIMEEDEDFKNRVYEPEEEKKIEFIQ